MATLGIRTLGVVLAGVLVLAAVIVSLDQPGGPISELHGVVVSSAPDPRDNGPSSQVATIALSDGPKVQATVASSLVVAPGQPVRVNEYSGAMTGRKTYQVVSVEAK